MQPYRVRLLGVLERASRLLRRAGLGRLVDGAARVAAPRLGSFELEVDGFRLHGGHVAHLYYVRELLDEGREGFMAELLEEAVPAGGTVVEVGAHIGYLTLRSARAAGPEGHVFAFEANPATLPVLRRNLQANGFAERVTVIPAAVADTAGRRRFYLTEGGDTSSLHRSPLTSSAIDVDVTTVDASLAASTVVDVVKLDVEGGESAVLRGMSRTLEAASPRLVVFAECHPALLEGAGSSVDELLGLLRGHGLELGWIDEQRRSVRPIEEADWSHGYANLCCRRAAGRQPT